jgi:DNA mismatch repair protein MutS
MTQRGTTNREPGTGDAAPSAVVPVSPHPQPPAPRTRSHPLSLLSGAPAAQAAAGQEDRSYARDLNLDQIVAAVAGDREERDLITSVLFRRLHDPGTVRYRQEVFQDLEDLALHDAVQRFSGLLSEVRAHLRELEQMRDTRQRQGWFLDAAAIYCDAVTSLAGYLAPAQPGSRALRDFRDYLVSYAASPGFTALASDTRDRKESLKRIRYCTRIRGGRVEVSRYDGEADYSAAVLKTFERFKQGAARDYLVRYRTQPGMNHIAAQITELVARLFPDEFADLEAYCRQHAGFPDEGITRADRELQFYLAYLDYIRPVRAAGLSFCYPEVSASSTDVHAAGTFDLALARKLATGRKPVVTNDFRLAGPERVIVVTGPNQGGKTTFARMFGQLHYLASLGYPVPGRAARLFLPDRVFTHFEREEDITTLRGKLEDELTRIHEILQQATSDSILIMNESFTSTTLNDALFLGTEMMRRVMPLGLLGVYVTFVDELASLSDATVSMVSTVVPDNPAERTYQVVRKPADGLAYAAALAEKYGLTYRRVKERISS